MRHVLIFIPLLILLACQSTTATPTPKSVIATTEPTEAAATETPTASVLVPTPEPTGLVVLTSPPPQPPPGLADASTPAYEPSTGFTPDAVRVLTVLSIQVALARYQSEHNAYPPTLADLFPADAPLGQDGQPLSAPPDGYHYSESESGYDLSVTLSSGQPYAVHAQ